MLELPKAKDYIFNKRRNMTLFEALKDFISVLKSHFVEGWMTYKSSIIQMSTTELTITWILEKEFILTMLNMKWAKPFAFLKANTWIEGIGNTFLIFFYKSFIFWWTENQQRRGRNKLVYWHSVHDNLNPWTLLCLLDKSKRA